METLSYTGQKAIDYDAKRMNSKKWKTENIAVESLLPYDARSVVDIPCGTGRFFDLYKARNLHYVGVDASFDMLDQSRAKHRDAELLQGDIRNLGKSFPQFDVAVCCRLTGWLSPKDLKTAMAELFRVAAFVLVGIRTTSGETIQKGKLFIHEHANFINAIAPHRIKAIYSMHHKRLFNHWSEIDKIENYVTDEKGYNFYLVKRCG